MHLHTLLHQPFASLLSDPKRHIPTQKVKDIKLHDTNNACLGLPFFQKCLALVFDCAKLCFGSHYMCEYYALLQVYLPYLGDRFSLLRLFTRPHFFLKTKYAFIEIESPFKCLIVSSLFENTYWFLTYRTANLGSNESNRIGFIDSDVLNASNRLDNNDNTIT